MANNGFSLVIGSRFILGGSSPNFSLKRKFLSVLGNWLLRYIGGLSKIHDCTSGFRCIKADLIEKCNFTVFVMRGYSFQSSFLFELIKNGAKVIEVPITFKERVHGESKLTLKDQLEFLLNILKIRFHK